MSIEADLKKDGIKIIKKLDTLKINSIARNVSIRICNIFPYFNLKQDDLFIKLSRLNMYIAEIPEGMAEANYFYKNCSIYFNKNIPYEDLEEFAIHECIHYIQEVKDKKGFLLKMGLCDYTEFKVYGLALNEASVQLMTSKILGIKKEFVKYFNLEFETTSPSYYPLECCLVSQLAYLTDSELLFKSTIYSDDNFKENLAKIIGYKNFIKIENNLDKILINEEKIIKTNNIILEINDRNKKVDHLIERIDELKKTITSIFIETQNLIMTSFFDAEFDKINSLDDIEQYRKKLYNFKSYLAYTDNYTFYNDYYVSKMMHLEEKSNAIENAEHSINTNLLPKKTSKFLTFINAIRKFFFKDRKTNSEVEK